MVYLIKSDLYGFVKSIKKVEKKLKSYEFKGCKYSYIEADSENEAIKKLKL